MEKFYNFVIVFVVSLLRKLDVASKRKRETKHKQIKLPKDKLKKINYFFFKVIFEWIRIK